MRKSTDPINAPYRDIPATIPILIDAALAALDEDRDTSRRYLLRASALLDLKQAALNAETAMRSNRGGLLAWQLKRVFDYIEAHLADPIAAVDLAGVISVSAGQLFRAFKISVGVTPFRYIARRRVELACTMIRTTREPLAQIAVACGVCDQAYLCKMFRRLIGMSPSAWRREQQLSRANDQPYCRLPTIPLGEGPLELGTASLPLHTAFNHVSGPVPGMGVHCSRRTPHQMTYAAMNRTVILSRMATPPEATGENCNPSGMAAAAVSLCEPKPRMSGYRR